MRSRPTVALASVSPATPLSRRRWAIATLLGWVIGWTLGWRLLALLPGVPGLEFVFWAVPGAIAGIVVGLAQWIALRRVEAGLWTWVPATALGMAWGAGGGLVVLIVLLDALRGGGFASIGSVPLWVAGFALVVSAGLPAGAILQWSLLRRRLNVSAGARPLMLAGWMAGLMAIWVGFLWSVALGQLFGAPNWAAFAALWAFSLVGGAAHALGTTDPIAHAAVQHAASSVGDASSGATSELETEDDLLARFFEDEPIFHRP